jgi:putative tryptophan/tyrosine transport system substrate-binding protein
MRRREFIAGLAGAAAWPVVASAQQSAIPVVGFLASGSRERYAIPLRGFRKGLSETGYVEGPNLFIEYRFAENRLDRLPALAADLVHRRVAVIATGARADEAAKIATATIPIVFMTGGDPVRTGLVASLNRPGGNLTGITLLASDMAPKRLGLLRELVPNTNTVALLLDETFKKNQEFQLAEMQEAGRNIGMRIVAVWVGKIAEFDSAFATFIQQGAGALVVGASVFFISELDRLVALAARYGIPAIYQNTDYVGAGGLMSYGPSEFDHFRQGGVYVGRILKGEKPADLPVLLPTKFELVINLKTAKALGLEVPETLLATADEVIE